MRCCSYKCNNVLETMDEFQSGLCLIHLEAMKDDRYFVGICWNCLKPTLVESRYSHKKELIIKDKYIFAKGCRCCSDNEEKNVDWMTIQPDSKKLVKSDKIVTNKGLTQSSKGVSIISA